jgi:cytochrome P450
VLIGRIHVPDSSGSPRLCKSAVLPICQCVDDFAEGAHQQATAIGFGFHRCMGLRIAELPLRILVREILARFAFIELVGPAVRLRSNMANEYTEMHVRLKERR